MTIIILMKIEINYKKASLRKRYILHIMKDLKIYFVLFALFLFCIYILKLIFNIKIAKIFKKKRVLFLS